MEVLRCRFLEHIPGEIMSLACRDQWCLVVLQDSSVQVFKTATWTLWQTYPASKALDLRKAIWHDKDSFVSAGLGGLLILWNLNDLVPQISHRVPGGGIWDISSTNTTYALACDDGVLRIYELDEAFTLQSSFPKQDSKLLCVQSTPDFYYAGTSNGSILKFTPRGNCLLRMNTDAPVWCLQVVNDFVVAGAGDGVLSFWDSRQGVLVQSIKTHQADVLCLCAKDSNVYASGVDSKVVRCSLNGNEWIITGTAKGQSHDIRSLDTIGENLISGGVNSDICIYTPDIFNTTQFNSKFLVSNKNSYKKFSIRHIPTLPVNSIIKATKNHVLHNTGYGLDLWNINYETQSITKILNINTKSNSSISSFGISFNMKWIAYSTLYCFRLISLDLETYEVQYTSTDLLPSSVISFSEGILYTGYTDLYTLHLKSLKTTHVHKFNSFAIKICSEGSYACVLLNTNKLNIYKNSEFLFNLPVVEKLITGIGFGYHKTLYAICEDNMLYGYNLKTQELDNYTSKYGHRFPKNFMNEVNRTIGILKYQKNCIVLYTHYSFTLINLKAKPPKKCEILSKDYFPEFKNSWPGVLGLHSLHGHKRHGFRNAETNLGHFCINKRFGPILDICKMDQEWLVCELDWGSALESKPKPLATHKYGS